MSKPPKIPVRAGARMYGSISSNAASGLQRQIMTPEGIPLNLDLAGAGDRAAAFLLDLFLMLVALIALNLLARAAHLAGSGEIIQIVWLLGFFLLRVFYFTLFEVGPRAATPGKRMLGLRVTTRNGERLNANAVVARNAMREIEVFLPLSFLFSNAAGQSVDAALILLGLVWSGIFLFFPLFNRDRLRVGDFIAGTWVIRNPKMILASDIAKTATKKASFEFTDTQLDAYGVHELHVLEGILRKNDEEILAAVSDRIRKKINWERGLSENNFEFLSSYYAQTRKMLESKLLFGVRRKDKHDRR